MVFRIVGLIVCFLGSLVCADDAIRESVVKIHVTQRPPDFLRPWTKGRPRKTSGSGVVVEGNRILTNAHVVLYASQIHVQGHQSSKREKAKLVAIAPEVDLAVLSLKEESFFINRPPLPINSQIPKLKEKINVYGYPIGGEQLSITEGIISRIECGRIAYRGFGLQLQIDAALNPGNSGGPAVVNDQVVGLAYSGIRTADNIGYVIGAEEVERFLANIPDGAYIKKPKFHERVQTVENEALREWLGLNSEQGGLFITTPASSADDYALKRHDVVTKMGDYNIDRKGYVQISDNLKVSFQYLIPRLCKDEKVRATVVRNGMELEVDIPVPNTRETLIPVLKGKYPSYFVFGPMLFLTPSQEFMKAIQATANSLAHLESPLIARIEDRPAFPDEQLVMLGSRLFPHATSEGYERTGLAIVEKINGERVKNLAHAASLLKEGTQEYIQLELVGSSTKFLNFKREDLEDAAEEILEDEGIRLPYSDDLSQILE